MANPDPSWRSGKTTAERGYGSRWQRASRAFLAANALCSSCKARGRLTVASLVDHTIPHRGDQALFWNTDNWSPMCAPCHAGKTLAEQGRKPRRAFDLNGNPTGGEG